MDKDLIEEMGQELLACAATIEKATAALGVMEELASELAATKKTLGTLIVWLQLDLGSENVERLLAMMSSSQREAAESADEKPDGQAENAQAMASADEKTPPKEPTL
jgi:hypothetical protein